MELMELQCDTLLKQKYAEVGIPEFYKFLPFDKFPKLSAFALRIMAKFGSTCVCEQFFSTMKVNKSAIRSRLTDEHLQSVIRFATIKDASLKPDIDSLVNSVWPLDRLFITYWPLSCLEFETPALQQRIGALVGCHGETN